MPIIRIPKHRSSGFGKYAYVLNLSTEDRKWLFKQGEGYYVLYVKDIWTDSEELVKNIEAKLISRKSLKKEKKDDPQTPSGI